MLAVKEEEQALERLLAALGGTVAEYSEEGSEFCQENADFMETTELLLPP